MGRGGARAWFTGRARKRAACMAERRKGATGGLHTGVRSWALANCSGTLRKNQGSQSMLCGAVVARQLGDNSLSHD